MNVNKTRMIMSLGFWLGGLGPGWAITAGVFDNGILVPVITNGVMDAVQKGEDIAKMQGYAQGTCNQARWALHKAEQLYYEAVKLTKDVKGMISEITPDLNRMETRNANLNAHIAEINSTFGPMLFCSIVGAVAFVVVFGFCVAARGKHLRSELDNLRGFESSLSAKQAPLETV